MNKQLVEFIASYKSSRSEFLNKVYQDDRSLLGRIASRVISPSQEQFVEEEIKFHTTFIEDVEAIQLFRGKNPVHFDWSSAILLVKNKSERVAYQIDYLNYFHTFLAFTLVIAILFANKSPIGLDAGGLTVLGLDVWRLAAWGLVAVVCVFITKVFVDRSTLRLELSIYKEIINLFELQKAILTKPGADDGLKPATS